MKKKLYRNIVFSKTPLTTQFRFADVFQIYPCDFANAPKSVYCHDFPLVIEYWVDEEEEVLLDDFWGDLNDHAAETFRQNKTLNRLTRLMTALTNHRIFTYGEVEFKWGSALPFDEIMDADKEKLNKQPSQSFLPFYIYPEMRDDLRIDKFSEQRYPSAKLVNQFYYFSHDPFDDQKKVITMPHTIYEALNNYFKLDMESLKIVNVVIHLISNGLELRNKMKSLSFLSFVSAIETLANYEYRKLNDEIVYDCPNCKALKSSPVSCEKCGRPIWGVVGKFKTFLKAYVSVTAPSIKKYNRIYNLRSGIVHNGALLLGDEQFNWLKSEKADNEYMTHLEAIQASRLALMNWLLLGAGRKILN